MKNKMFYNNEIFPYQNVFQPKVTVNTSVKHVIDGQQCFDDLGCPANHAHRSYRILCRTISRLIDQIVL